MARPRVRLRPPPRWCEVIDSEFAPWAHIAQNMKAAPERYPEDILPADAWEEYDAYCALLGETFMAAGFLKRSLKMLPCGMAPLVQR